MTERRRWEGDAGPWLLLHPPLLLRSLPVPPGPPRSPGPSAGRSEADAVVAPVEFGVVVPDEGGAQDPEGSGRRGDVQPRESHHAHVLPVLGLLREGNPRGDGGGAGGVPLCPLCSGIAFIPRKEVKNKCGVKFVNVSALWL